jgi:hypothetical protein
MASHAILTDMMVHRRLIQEDWTRRARVKVHVMLVINDQLAPVDHLFEAAREMRWTISSYRAANGPLECAIEPTGNVLDGIQIWRGTCTAAQIPPLRENVNDSL